MFLRPNATRPHSYPMPSEINSESCEQSVRTLIEKFDADGLLGRISLVTSVRNSGDAIGWKRGLVWSVVDILYFFNISQILGNHEADKASDEPRSGGGEVSRGSKAYRLLDTMSPIIE
jgi:hypothetical protein